MSRGNTFSLFSSVNFISGMMEFLIRYILLFLEHLFHKKQSKICDKGKL